MKEYLKNIYQLNKFIIYKTLVIVFFWRLFLLIIEIWIAPLFPLRSGYLHIIPWLNFDGIHYLSIAQNGYMSFQQAFFPLFPILIRLISNTFILSLDASSLILSHFFFMLSIYIVAKFLEAEKNNKNWPIILLLFFPTSFFFATGYNTSLFLLLAAACIYFAQKKYWSLAGLFGFLASATRLSGVFLVIIVIAEWYFDTKRKTNKLFFILFIPLGAVVYSFYLWYVYGDPLSFFHVQSAFGANRSSSSLILLPQVLWRYAKILFFVPLSNCKTNIFSCNLVFPYDWWISFLEASTLLFISVVLWLGWKSGYKKHYIYYCLIVTLLPTLTGTLSSLPRYIFDAFPLFFIIGSIKQQKIKVILLVLFLFCFVTLTIAFLRGYFVA